MGPEKPGSPGRATASRQMGPTSAHDSQGHIRDLDQIGMHPPMDGVYHMDRSSVAATRPAVSRLTKPRLFSDSTGPTAPYLLESRLRLGRDFQSTQVDFFCLFFSFQNYILQHIKKHKVLLFYYVNIQCASYKLVTLIWTSLRINPAHMKSALLEMTIKMLDIIHHPCHFNASLKRQMTLRLHLPLRARRSPWPDFGWV